MADAVTENQQEAQQKPADTVETMDTAGPEQAPSHTETAQEPHTDNAVENHAPAQPQAPVPPSAPAARNLQSIPTRQYLDQTIVPILLQGLGALAKERPENPVDFLAKFLLREKDRYTIQPNSEN
ncbi:unnamed protein product [Caenorhabditis auriculariae]|uniref:Uncharacterized protein n=1 Tax=Caenorhabditis auriculariae TaxID=2777116 RepID=A0A8S1GT68_9PELO|nr:unnamed protein product [Caenorhabditis auriculariae]